MPVRREITVHSACHNQPQCHGRDGAATIGRDVQADIGRDIEGDIDLNFSREELLLMQMIVIKV